MEKLSGELAYSYCCFWNFCICGQYVEGILSIKSKGNGGSLAFDIFDLPSISTWSLVFDLFLCLLNSFMGCFF